MKTTFEKSFVGELTQNKFKSIQTGAYRDSHEGGEINENMAILIESLILSSNHVFALSVRKNLNFIVLFF